MPTSICTIRFHIRTILFAFRRGVGLPLPLHRPTPFPQPLQKGNTPSPHTTTLASLVKGEVLSPDKLGRRPEGLPHHHSLPRTNPSKTALSLASHHHTCLPCQREVDWRQGTNLNIIAFTCDMSTLFILQTFLPSRRRDCNTYCALSVSLTPPLTIPQSQ